MDEGLTRDEARRVGLRALALLRFVFYGAVLLAGFQHFFGGGDAAGRGDAPALTGRTQYGVVALHARGSRATDFGLDLVANCRRGGSMRDHAGFFDAFEGDFRHDGRRFADSWYQEHSVGGRVARVSAHVEGLVSADGGRASGVFREVVRWMRGSRTVDVCRAEAPWEVSRRG